MIKKSNIQAYTNIWKSKKEPNTLIKSSSRSKPIVESADLFTADARSNSDHSGANSPDLFLDLHCAGSHLCSQSVNILLDFIRICFTDRKSRKHEGSKTAQTSRECAESSRRCESALEGGQIELLHCGQCSQHGQQLLSRLASWTAASKCAPVMFSSRG